MKKYSVVFIAVSDYDNLGVGYMAALLSEAGYQTRIINFRGKNTNILKTLKKTDPLIIGFSVIHLGYLNKFIELTEYLRKGGIKCHFTAGGHYASLKSEELFKCIPQLDSIIRFEGEYPMLALAESLSEGTDWRKIRSLAYKEKNKVVKNPVWPQEKELDKLPYPQRFPLKEYAFHRKFTAILAGRGCTHNCSFCNTRAFYRQASAPLKRIRKPENVVSEMHYLYLKKKCSVFLFHDDDFPVKSKIQHEWIEKFCLELERTGLNRKILWKINCRPDEIEEESFSLMKKNGLFLVFVGLEDGTTTGLNLLNKQITVSKNVEGISILKKLNIGFDYGFMLFQPSTTFSSLIENLGFLRNICSDGYTPVTFLKLIPLYETQIERELKEEGRLHYSDGIGDYTFPEETMNQYYDFISDCFTEWLRNPRGLENISKWARNYCSVFLHNFPDCPEAGKFNRKIKRIIAKSNLLLLDNMEELAYTFKQTFLQKDKSILENYKQRIKIKHDYYLNKILQTMTEMLSFAEHQKIIINP